MSWTYLLMKQDIIFLNSQFGRSCLIDVVAQTFKCQQDILIFSGEDFKEGQVEKRGIQTRKRPCWGGQTMQCFGGCFPALRWLCQAVVILFPHHWVGGSWWVRCGNCVRCPTCGENQELQVRNFDLVWFEVIRLDV